MNPQFYFRIFSICCLLMLGSFGSIVGVVTDNETIPQIGVEQLEYWDKVAYDLNQKKPLLNGGDRSLFAYLYLAQKAFADAAYHSTGAYEGSLDPISFFVVNLFYPDYKDPKAKEEKDSFSEKLTAQLAPKIQERFQNEKRGMHPVEVQKGEEKWQGKEPYIGRAIPTMNPWVLRSPDEFRLAPPPPLSDKEFWEKQCAIIKHLIANATDEQKKKVLFWAGMTAPNDGDLNVIVNKYLEEKDVPLRKRLEVRAKLAVAMNDAMIAAYDTKYTYLIKRPYMIDKKLKPLIDTPNHPSYPSAHSTVCAAGVVILTHFFPEDRQKWLGVAEEAGMSRLWGGIHFPIDHEVGKVLGTKVGQAVLQRPINWNGIK